MSATATADVPRTLTEQERKAKLAQAVAAQVRNGWRVDSQTDYQAIMGKGKRTSHGVHIFLSLVTLGFWIPVWLVVWFSNRDLHRIVDIDPYGHLNVS